MASRTRFKVSAALIFGFLLIFWGSLQLLDRFGILEQEKLWKFWPIALIVVGLLKVLSPGQAGRFWGGILLLAGILLQLSHLGYLSFHFWDLWPLLLIAIGVNLIWNVMTRSRGGPETESSVSDLNEWTIFGGGERHINSPDFRGGEVLAIFGGYDIDLRKAGIKSPGVVLEAYAIFGGIEIKVPEDWNVIVRGAGIMGGFGDSRTNLPIFPVESYPERLKEQIERRVVEDAGSQKTEDRPTEKRFKVKGIALFGGVEVKN